MSKPVFPLARYTHCNHSYYAYGNTQAEDFLQCCSGVKKPSILSLANGDIRSCFYTLWKNFVSNAPQQFDGADILLNDINPAVLARNIVLIYLCLQLPDGVEDRKKYLCAMWAVWYCHELYPPHQKVLNGSLKLFLKYSESLETWDSPENPLRSLVHFTSPAVLVSIAKFWKTWLGKLGGSVSVKQMQSSRQKHLKLSMEGANFKDWEEFSLVTLRNNMLIVGSDSEHAIRARIPEVVLYLESGSFFAEHVFHVDLPPPPTDVNFTLYDRQDGTYTLFYVPPFNSYYHTVEFSPKTMIRAGVRKDACASMLVPSASFKSNPLWSNCIQQFSMWVQSSSAVLKKGVVSFTFNDQDALAFCRELQHGEAYGSNQFDAIFSSNLMDHVGLANLVLSVMPLLTPAGLFLAGTMMYRYTSMTCFDKYLSLCFGFDCKLLPVILGVRCINHEGAGYASPVMIQPCPERKRPQRLLIWQKATGQPMCISKLPSPAPGNVTEGLVGSFRSSISLTAHRENFDGNCLIRNYNIETALHVLQTFKSSLTASSDYQFYENLCSALLVDLKPTLWGLQTQALLHGLHMHFKVDEATCPMCRHIPVENFLGLFCAEVSKPYYGVMNFIAFIHPYSLSNLQELASLDEMHVIDCFDGSVSGQNIVLKFFAPKSFAACNLNVTFVCCLPTKKMEILSTTNLRSIEVEFVQYNFASTGTSALKRSCSVSQSFGVLLSNVYHQHSVVSEISVSDLLLESLANEPLKTNSISSSEIQLSSGALRLNVKFLYPVDYAGIKVELSRAQRNVKLFCPRQIHSFEEEKAIFVALPDHQLSLPPQDVKREVLQFHSFMQTVSDYRKVGSEANHAFKQGPLRLAMDVIANFFLYRDVVFFFIFSNGGICGQVFVNKLVFDYQNYAPAVDLAFYFSESNSRYQSDRRLQGRGMRVDEATCRELKKILMYFASRTNGDCKSAGANSVYRSFERMYSSLGQLFISCTTIQK